MQARDRNSSCYPSGRRDRCVRRQNTRKASALPTGSIQGSIASHAQTVKIEAAVAISTDEAATRRAAPYMLAKR